MRILITGAKGHLGRQLSEQFQAHTIIAADIDTLDVTDARSVNQYVADATPDLVIHCAALTSVDYCAQHPDEALRINGFGTQHVAQACQEYGAALLYISTNEVFDGRSRQPYLEYDPTNPINPYAYSKWVGEQVVRDLVPRHIIVRTSWLFAHSGQNFVHAILRRASAGEPLRVVVNEVASPTYTCDLAAALAKLVEAQQYGIYHLTNDGHTSRYGFARTLLDLAGYAELPIEPIALAEYDRASRPPEYAVLRNFAAARLGITLRPWHEALTAFLEAERILTK
jgi:dTDP-4-dehydrorhamnose reductase